jgi:hypothetical protein
MPVNTLPLEWIQRHEGWGWLFLCVLLVLVLLPPKYDPAIRWKERNERKRK